MLAASRAVFSYRSIMSSIYHTYYCTCLSSLPPPNSNTSCYLFRYCYQYYHFDSGHRLLCRSSNIMTYHSTCFFLLATTCFLLLGRLLCFFCSGPATISTPANSGFIAAFNAFSPSVFGSVWSSPIGVSSDSCSYHWRKSASSSAGFSIFTGCSRQCCTCASYSTSPTVTSTARANATIPSLHPVLLLRLQPVATRQRSE